MSKLVRILLWVVAIVVLAVGALFLFVDQSVTVTRTHTVSAPVEVAFDQVNDLHNWEKWSPWYERDPQMTITYDGSGVGPGASYSWASEKDDVGNGKLAILETQPNESIKTRIDFEGMDPSYGGWAFKSMGAAQTEVSWSMTSDAGMNPMARFFNILLDGLVGPDFEKGLASLDREAQVAYAAQQAEAEAAAAAAALEAVEAEAKAKE